MGEKMNCIAEKEAMIAPMTRPCAPKCRLYRGISGTTMPKPMRSMKTVRKMMRTEGFFMRPNKTRSLTFPTKLLLAYVESSGECPIVKETARSEQQIFLAPKTANRLE